MTRTKLASDPSKREIYKLVAATGETTESSLRSSQNGWIGYNVSDDGKTFSPLGAVKNVLVAATDGKDNPAKIMIYEFDADLVHERFQKNLEARRAAGYLVPPGTPIFISLFEKDGSAGPLTVGGGLGLEFDPIAVYPIDNEGALAGREDEQDTVLEFMMFLMPGRPATTRKGVDLQFILLIPGHGVHPTIIQILLHASRK